MPRVHAAIIDTRLTSGLLEGRKRVETRFGRHRRPPFGRVSRGDEIYFKASGGPIIGRAYVLRIQQYDDLTRGAIRAIRRKHGHLILATSDYWRARRDCRFGVLIWLGAFSPRGCPQEIPRQYGAGWVVLSR